MFSPKSIATTLLLAEAAWGKALTTIVPCRGAPENITVTSQHQPVSTCTFVASSISWSSYNYVSTVIPCWGGSSISSCTVTETAQPVACSGTVTTVTSVVPIATGKPDGTSVNTTYSTTYQTISKQWVAPYNKLGPFAIPGYGGCELCTECGVQGDGSRKQVMNVTECTSAVGKASVCSKFIDTWVSQPVPSATGAVVARVSSKAAVPGAGTYTFTFAQPAPSTTIQSGKQMYTVPARPWNAYVTQSCSGPTTFDFTVTVTKVVTFNVPYSTNSDAKKTPAPEGFSHQGWGQWQPATASKTTSSSSVDPWGAWSTTSSTPSKATDPTDGMHWNAWSGSSEGTKTVILTTLSTTTLSTTPMITTTESTTSMSTTTESTTTESTTPMSTTTETTTAMSTTTVSSTTSDVQTTPYTSSTSTTLSTSWTSSTTTSTGTPPVVTTSFLIEVGSGGLRRRYTKRADTLYVGFLDGSDDATLVTENPVKFFFDNEGYLRTGTQYIAGDSSSGYFVFEKGNDKPASPPNYSLGADGSFSLAGAGFCTTGSNFFVTLGSAPSNCKQVTCKSTDGTALSASTTTTTTTAQFTTTTTETSATTTTSADPSADLDYPEPTPDILSRRSARYAY